MFSYHRATASPTITMKAIFALLIIHTITSKTRFISSVAAFHLPSSSEKRISKNTLKRTLYDNFGIANICPTNYPHSPVPLFAASTTSTSTKNLQSGESKNDIATFFSSFFSPSSSSTSTKNKPKQHKILLLGSTGFLGKTISNELSKRNIPFVSVSRSQDGEKNNQENSNHIYLDLTTDDASSQIEDIIKRERCTAVISAVGSIGTPEDLENNAVSGKVASAARTAGAKRFVFIGNAPRVREVMENIPFLKDYREGKMESTKLIKEQFEDEKSKKDDIGYCIICPTFIFGGDEFNMVPPRLPQNVGALAEEVLGLYPFQALAEAMPGLIGVALESPVGVDSVAKASINAAVGLCDSFTFLDTKEDIVMVASKRLPSSEPIQGDAKALEEKRKAIKSKLKALGDGNEEAFALIEELEYLKPKQTKPAFDKRLNGPWDFNFSVEPDMGTGVVKSLLEKKEDEKSFFFSLDNVCMEISDNAKIEITVSTRVLKLPVQLQLFTSLQADDSNEDGTMFMETFEGASLFGVNLPIPKSWKRSRYLEFSYLDDDMVVARGNGREPHFLLRENKNEKIETAKSYRGNV